MKFAMELRMRPDGAPVVTVGGTLDLSNAPRLRGELRRLIQEDHAKVIVDLDALDYIDSSGLGVLVGALARIRERNGDLPIVVSNPRIRRIFDVTKLAYVFPMHPTQDAVP